ncbi:ABC transporter permease [Bradyrhizobium japonicum]|uniref:ABC transporter permease n=1 Tax=Bradyrhizobium japonicum TaxID=375 RepID=UPI001CB6CDEC|nr:ABC transporter permease [Bradyrhizobium japonicum]
MTILLPAAIVAGLAGYSPHFLDQQNIWNVTNQLAALVAAALAQLFVVIIGGLDLSVGSVASLSTCIVATSESMWVGVGVSLLLGGLVGAANGVGVGVFRVHPIIMTLATMAIVQGVALAWLPIPGGKVPEVLLAVSQGGIVGIPYSTIWIASLCGAASLALNRTRFGVHLYALGASQTNAFLNGLRAVRLTIAAYSLSGVLAAVAGIYLSTRVASGDPNIGVGLSLQSITAVALGGVQLAGAVGSVAGVLLGAVTLGLLDNGMNLLGVSGFVQSIVSGSVLLVAICLQPRQQIGL